MGCVSGRFFVAAHLRGSENIPKSNYLSVRQTAGTTGELLIMFISRPSSAGSPARRNAMLSQSRFVVLAALLSMSPLACLGQAARPALMPSSQGGGASAAASGSTTSSLGTITGLTDEPITPGQTIYITVFNAPDFSVVTRVSESGDVAYPMLGVVHVAGLNSVTAAALITGRLKKQNLMLDPHVTVTVDTSSSGITILGEVHTPGVYPPPGKHLLSDMLATAGGLTINTGRVIEISNERTPDKKTYIPWDPTMHNTSNYDLPIHPGDRILVRACGIAYVGGHVIKPGAYSLCGSKQITLSEVIALAGGVAPLSSEKHTYLVRTQPDGARIVQQIDLNKVLRASVADPVVQEDDIIYVSPSALKDAATRALGYAFGLAGPLIMTSN